MFSGDHEAPGRPHLIRPCDRGSRQGRWRPLVLLPAQPRRWPMPRPRQGPGPQAAAPTPAQRTSYSAYRSCGSYLQRPLAAFEDPPVPGRRELAPARRHRRSFDRPSAPPAQADVLGWRPRCLPMRLVTGPSRRKLTAAAGPEPRSSVASQTVAEAEFSALQPIGRSLTLLAAKFGFSRRTRTPGTKKALNSGVFVRAAPDQPRKARTAPWLRARSGLPCIPRFPWFKRRGSPLSRG